MKIACDVYKSVNKENYYLYVLANQGLEHVPEGASTTVRKSRNCVES